MAILAAVAEAKSAIDALETKEAIVSAAIAAVDAYKADVEYLEAQAAEKAAAVATAKAELGGKKTYTNTLIFWVLTSYVVSAVVYTVGSWWWTAFIWAFAFALCVLVIGLINKKTDKRRD